MDLYFNRKIQDNKTRFIPLAPNHEVHVAPRSFATSQVGPAAVGCLSGLTNAFLCSFMCSVVYKRILINGRDFQSIYCHRLLLINPLQIIYTILVDKITNYDR